MSRTLRPRDSVAAPAVTVSQLTCLVLLGVNGRRYLDIVRTERIEHVRIGKLVVVEVRHWLAALERMRAAHEAQAGSRELAAIENSGAEELTSVADVLELVGMRRRSA